MAGLLLCCADAESPELTRLVRPIDSWRAELLAYFDNYWLRLHCGVDWELSAPPRSEAGYHAWRRRALRVATGNVNQAGRVCFPMGPVLFLADRVTHELPTYSG